MTRRRAVTLAAVLVVGVGLVASVGASVRPRAADLPRIGGPFTLTGQDGKIYRDSDFLGSWMLVGFGFTNCVDVCPRELLAMAQILDGLGAAAARVRPLFISLDPLTDRPERLATFLNEIDPRIFGLTGDPVGIAALADAYRVGPHRLADGTLQHGGFLYLMGPDGAFRTLLRPVEGGPELARRVARLVLYTPPPPAP